MKVRSRNVKISRRDIIFMGLADASALVIQLDGAGRFRTTGGPFNFFIPAGTMGTIFLTVTDSNGATDTTSLPYP